MRQALLKTLCFAAVIFVVSAAAACMSVPTEAEIPPDLTSAELLQQAQNYYDKGNIPAAQVVYQVILSRFSDDPNVTMAAEYELVHIKVKQKRWEEALPMIDELLQKYDTDISNRFPRAYYKLLELDRAKIPPKFLPKDEQDET